MRKTAKSESIRVPYKGDLIRGGLVSKSGPIGNIQKHWFFLQPRDSFLIIYDSKCFFRGVIICGFMVYTVKDLCEFIVDLLWIFEDLCRFMQIYGGFVRIYFPQNGFMVYTILDRCLPLGSATKAVKFDCDKILSRFWRTF